MDAGPGRVRTLSELIGGDPLVELDAAMLAAFDAVDPQLLTRCQQRIAMVLGHAPTLDAAGATVLEALANWPNDAALSDRDRAALALTEQYLIDVSSITDEQVRDVASHLGDGPTADFVNALVVVEQRMRLELALSRVLVAAP